MHRPDGLFRICLFFFPSIFQFFIYVWEIATWGGSGSIQRNFFCWNFFHMKPKCSKCWRTKFFSIQPQPRGETKIGLAMKTTMKNFLNFQTIGEVLWFWNSAHHKIKHFLNENILVAELEKSGRLCNWPQTIQPIYHFVVSIHCYTVLTEHWSIPGEENQRVLHQRLWPRGCPKTSLTWMIIVGGVFRLPSPVWGDFSKYLMWGGATRHKW